MIGKVICEVIDDVCWGGCPRFFCAAIAKVFERELGSLLKSFLGRLLIGYCRSKWVLCWRVFMQVFLKNIDAVKGEVLGSLLRIFGEVNGAH